MSPSLRELYKGKSDGFHSLVDDDVVGSAPTGGGGGGGGPSLWGMNFEPNRSTDDPSSIYEQQAEIGRIYVATGGSDIMAEAEVSRAYGLGCRNFIFSWKDAAGSSLPWMNTIPNDVTWYGVAHHEPEDLSIATYKALQADAMPRVRAHGGIPATIFTSYSVNNPNNTGFNINDWMPTGSDTLFDCFGVDYYPDKEPAFTQAQIKAHWVTAMADWGLPRLIVGEYATPNGSGTYTSTTVTQFKALMEGFSEANTWWANEFAPNPNYRFSSSTGTAWYA